MSIGGSGDVWLPWFKVAVREMDAQYPGFSWGTYNGHEPVPSRAADAMVLNWQTAAGKARGWELAKWLWTNRKRFNIWYVIFDEKIISQTPGKGSWLPYHATAQAIRNSEASAKHWNHVHVSVYADAPEGLTPSGTVWVDLLVPGVKDSTSIRLVQEALGVPPSGTLDAMTITATKKFQESLGDTVDGLFGPLQLAALFKKVNKTVIIRTDPSGEAPVVKPTPPKPTPADPKPETPAVTADVIYAGFNILRETDPDKDRERFNERLPDIIRHIESTRATVVSLCEVDKSTARRIFAGMGNDWNYYPSHFKTDGEFSPLAVGWNERIWERAGDVFVQEFSDNQNRFLLRVPLRHKATGIVQQVYASHFENDGDPKTDGHAVRFTESKDWAKWTLDGPGLGYCDFNSTTRGDIKKPTAREKQKPRVVLYAKGWRMATEQAKFRGRSISGHHGGKTGKPGGTPIDEILFKGVTFLDGWVVDTSGTDASDHQLFAIKVRISK